ncbi:MAG: ClpXP protease specificity-enhancing factor SspB [Pseudolabrys sp.]
MADHIRYDLLTQQALRGVVRSVLADAAKKGLPGDHHFFISFDTHADGVRISDRLRTQYPEEMTIILQHQFWHLSVNDRGFEVDLTFGGIMERLAIPYDAISGFFDPSVQFGLQFEDVTEGTDQKTAANAQDKSQEKLQDRSQNKPQQRVPDQPAKKRRPPALVETETQSPSIAAVPDPSPDKPTGGGEVVRLDRFRKKK